MCEDQRMAIVPWAALGGGQLMTAHQREEREKNPDARKGYGQNDVDIIVSEVLEKVAERHKATLQAIVSFESQPLFLSVLTSFGIGLGISLPSIDLCFPHCRCPNG